MTSWDALAVLLWFGLPAWAGLSLERCARLIPEEEPIKWEGLTPALFRGLLFCVLGHLVYASALPWLRQCPSLAGLLLPRWEEVKRHSLDPAYLMTLVAVVAAAALAGGASGMLNGWGWRAWRRLWRRAAVSPRSVWEEVFDGEQARWAVLYLTGGKVYEGQIERWSGKGEDDPHLLLASPSEYLQVETPEGPRWHVLDLQSDGLLIPRSRVELIELRPSVEEWSARQAVQQELPLAEAG